MIDPLISIIITCYNLGEFLNDAIDSALSQSYKKIEIFVVDDGSTDAYTIEFLKTFAAEKVIIVSQPNRGVSAARNYGASLAMGDYLLFLDGDDKIDETYLSKAVVALKNNPSLDYIYCDLKEFGQGNAVRILDHLYLNKQILYNLCHPSGVVSKELWNKAGGFDIEFVKGWEDWDFWLRVIRLNVSSYKIEEPLFYYRIRSNSRDKIAVQNNSVFLEQMIFSKNLSSYFMVYEKPISALREFEILKEEKLHFEEVKKSIYNSWSYRIGSFILTPLKLIAKVIVGR
jgi:glycosyltransferase involved in cell wall biosynthesis